MNKRGEQSGDSNRQPDTGFSWSRIRVGFLAGLLIFPLLIPGLYIFLQGALNVRHPVYSVVMAFGLVALCTWPFKRFGAVTGAIVGLLVALIGLALLALMLCFGVSNFR